MIEIDIDDRLAPYLLKYCLVVFNIVIFLSLEYVNNVKKKTREILKSINFLFTMMNSVCLKKKEFLPD